MVSTLRETSTNIQAQSDKLLGGLMLSVAAFVFAYYTAWAILLPFLDPYLDPFSPIHQLFPRRKWAIILPSVLLLLGISGVSLFFGKVVWSEARKRRAKELKRGS